MGPVYTNLALKTETEVLYGFAQQYQDTRSCYDLLMWDTWTVEKVMWASQTTQRCHQHGWIYHKRHPISFIEFLNWIETGFDDFVEILLWPLGVDEVGPLG